MLKEAVTDLLREHPHGMINAEIARKLELESDFEGAQKNYLSWSLLGLLVNEGRVRYEKQANSRLYFISD